MHDDGNIGYTAPGQNNQFDYRDGEYATSNDFQRHTVRLHGLYRAPWGISTALTYSYGSGALFAASTGGSPVAAVLVKEDVPVAGGLFTDKWGDAEVICGF